MLSCTDLTLKVPGRELCRGLSVAFEPGQAWAVLGRNGTGKSTLIHALAGLAAPAAGEVALDGVALDTLSARARARRLGVLLQMESGTWWGTVLEYVLLGRFPHASPLSGYSCEDIAHAHAALGQVGTGDLAARKLVTLSGGERQRVRIAQILAQQCGIVLLDEPLQHLDLAHQAQVLNLIGREVRERGQTAVMVLHEPLWIGRSCTHAVILNGDGSAVAGPAADVITRERLEHAYGCALREIGDGGGRSFVPDV
ncbi:MAG: putative siderophore transport system ATP-binding protein YusV [Betaproteobacteria bacterium]|nr:putative siderophore transport system ATP-binding protein YusV [Betaproteobacteria bacterium]